MPSNSSAFACSAAARPSSAGRSPSTISDSAARWIAVGKTSFVDWPMLTSSFACTSSPASVAITSFAFMFEDVPEPVWKTSIGNWSSSSPSATRSAASAMRAALSWSRSTSSPLTRAAAALIRPSQRATGAGIGSPETGKLATALRVSPPHSSFAVDAVSVTTWRLARTGGPQELLPRGQLHARSVARLPCGALGRVDRLPARVLDELDVLRPEHRVQRRGSVGSSEAAAACVFEQSLHGLRGVLLVRSDHAARAALDPAGGVRPFRVGDAAAVVRDRARPLVERHARDRNAAVADAAQDEPAGDRLRIARRARHDSAVLLDELVADDLDRLHLLLAEDRRRGD